MEDLNEFQPSGLAAGGTGKADVASPAMLLLSGQQVVSKAAPEALLYEMSRDVTSIPQKNSSVIFERAEDAQVGEAGTGGPEQNRHICYLAHPAGAEFQTDGPAYYITSVSADDAGEHRPPLHKALAPEAGVRG